MTKIYKTTYPCHNLLHLHHRLPHWLIYFSLVLITPLCVALYPVQSIMYNKHKGLNRRAWRLPDPSSSFSRPCPGSSCSASSKTSQAAVYLITEVNCASAPPVDQRFHLISIQISWHTLLVQSIRSQELLHVQHARTKTKQHKDRQSGE